MTKLKMAICEAPLLLLHKKCEVDANCTFFGEAGLMKLEVFGW
jgi:hypothetical protein